MTVHALGIIPVPVPGTPVPLTAGKVYANLILFLMPPGATGLVYVKSTLTGTIIYTLQPTLSPADRYEVNTKDGQGSLDLQQFSVDAALAGQGPLVTYYEE